MTTLVTLLTTLALLAAPDEPGVTQTPLLYSVEKASLGLVTFHVLRFVSSEVQMRLLLPEKGRTLQHVAQMPGCAQALACFNASFFLKSGRPMGLMVSESKVLQQLRKVSWGVFWVDRKQKPHVSRKRSFQDQVKLADVEFAVQSGPTVIRNAKRIPKDSKLASRTAVGINQEGQIVVLVTQSPLSLDYLSDFALTKLGITDLVNLDGGTSTQLTVNRLEKVNLRGAPVAVGVGLYPRSH